jgi:PAS domain S-box-containing protein
MQGSSQSDVREADFEVAPEPSFLLALDSGRIVRANAAAASMTGRAREALGGLAFDALAPAATPPPATRLLEAAKRDGAATAINLTMWDAIGAPTPVHADAWLTTRAGERLLHVMLHDGGELARERAERGRKRGARRVAELADADVRELLDQLLDECIALTESRFGYLYFYDEKSEEFTLHAWSRDVMKACTILAPQTIYHLEKTGIWGEAVRQRRPILLNDFAAPHALKKGYPEGHATLRRFLTIPVMRRGAIVAVVGVANREDAYSQHDVATLERFVDDAWEVVERRLEREAFEAGRRRLELALTGAHAGTFHWDASFDQTQWDDRLLAIYGLVRGTLDGRARPWSTLVSEGDRRRNEAAFARLLLDHGPFVLEYEVHRADGDVRTVRMRAELAFDAQREPRGLSGLVFDITETVRAEAERRRLAQRLQQAQKLAGLEVLSRGVAHEFNNVLQIVIGNAWELTQLLPPDTPGRELVTAIDQAGRRGAEVCRHLLAMAGRASGAPARIDVLELLRGQIAALGPSLAPPTTLRLELPPALPPVLADAGSLREALAGLIANATEAHREGGAPLTVTLTAGVEPCDRERVASALAAAESATDGEYVFLEVHDDGCGMDATTQARLFEPFFSTKGFGRGLGLATVLGVVRSRGGFATVRSVPDQGTTFRVWLPVAPPAPPPSSAPPAPEAPHPPQAPHV